jgi:thiol-disulfide isomerase/thioredoxin
MSTQQLAIGQDLPPFRGLPGTDGKPYSDSAFTGKVVVVVFSCNHCPYVQAYEERMVAFQKDYAGKSVQLVAINSNDVVNYPEDSFDKMKVRAAARRFNFPYLRDENQTVANSFGATHTPQFFVFDGERKLRYAGKFDDNWNEPRLVKEHFVRDAVDALLGKHEVKVAETFSIGCTIKWRA